MEDIPKSSAFQGPCDGTTEKHRRAGALRRHTKKLRFSGTP